MPSEERFDVALSFAGENSECARALADLLIAAGLDVFYDEYRQTELWGEHQTVFLADVYENRAEYVVLFISRHYAAKVWTQHELKSALTRAVRERRAYILPIRIDDTEIPGLNPAIAYLKWPPETPQT